MSRTLRNRRALALLTGCLLLAPGTGLAQSDAGSADDFEYGAGYDTSSDFSYDGYDDLGEASEDEMAEEAEAQAAESRDAAADEQDAEEVAPAPAETAEASHTVADRFRRGGEITMDLLVLRPFSAVATVAGFGFLVASSPFLAISGDSETARDVLLMERARYTFDRPLGQF